MRTTTALVLAACLGLSLSACGGDDGAEGPTMRPGANCLACHGFTAAGTVYTSGGAAASGVSVTIAGASRSIPLTTNSAGNFYTSEAITFPANVTVGGGGASMTAARGDCNTCHSGAGTGRIHP
jgi:hypothetical protein